MEQEHAVLSRLCKIAAKYSGGLGEVSMMGSFYGKSLATVCNESEHKELKRVLRAKDKWKRRLLNRNKLNWSNTSRTAFPVAGEKQQKEIMLSKATKQKATRSVAGKREERRVEATRAIKDLEVLS